MKLRLSRTAAAGGAALCAACLSLLGAPADQQTSTQPASAQAAPGTPAAPSPAPGGRGAAAAPAADDPANANADLSPKPPVLPLPASEQATRFWLPPGYRLEPVLSDPDIDSPGQ